MRKIEKEAVCLKKYAINNFFFCFRSDFGTTISQTFDTIKIFEVPNLTHSLMHQIQQLSSINTRSEKVLLSLLISIAISIYKNKGIEPDG